VLILDEPTLGLDPAARQDLRGVLRSLHQAGRTLLISTHLLDDVDAVCDRVLFLRDGHLVGDEPVRAPPAADDPTATRTLLLQFLDPVPPSAIEALLRPGETVRPLGAREVSVEIRGGDRAQAETVARIVTAGLPLLGIRPPQDPLTQRYLATVGREDGP
jgi:energy-coupling factor transporter ATP-binding protein EcfA2